MNTASPDDEVWGVLKTTAVQSFQYLEFENKELPSHLTPRPECEVAPGDILITRAGPKNRVAISCLVETTRPRLMISDKIIRFHLVEGGMYEKFVALCLNAGATAAYLEASKSGMAVSQMNITQEKLRMAPVPICSTAEQQRIVAKVDELMALCDRLETEQADAKAAHAKLIDILLGVLTQSTDASDLATNWQRLAQHFDSLFTTESSLDALERTILQLAVMGKLVPQDTEDEPASELLKRIAQERAQLEREGKVKKAKTLPPLVEGEGDFPPPKGWEWTRLANACAVITDGDHLPPPKANTGVPFLVIGNLNSAEISFEGSRFVPQSYFDSLDWSRRPTYGDLLYTVTGSFGITIPVATDSPFCVQRHVAILKSVPSSPAPYLLYFLRSPQAITYADSVATGIAQRTVTLGALRQMPVAIPPAAEQHRIVAKVNELMALCEHLKAHLAESRRRQERLASTLVESALKAA